ncbi:hypothetical protein [Thermospira aquatica]|uniref:YkuD domain-containing protein n=1 Tax=Thermospira aquatica TaxID=2828656 RepID=A0AAX3BB99_9SPIR|nr:hypothetical protein [Thermospira aquatica]URA09416.1 hypothetical protein KDW03_07930 [Thermospira aquatica]
MYQACKNVDNLFSLIVGEEGHGSNLFTHPAQPYGSETPEQQAQAMMENTEAIENEQRKKLEKELNNIWAENSKAYAGYGTTSPTKEEIAEDEWMKNASMYAPTMSEVDRRQFEDSYEVWQWNEGVERQLDLQIQEEYAERMRNEGKYIVTYSVDLATNKVYDGEGKVSQDGENQLAHYKLMLESYGDKLENVLKNSGDYIIIGEEGLGSNFTVGGNERTPGNMNKDPLNDRITILMRDGDRIIIKEFNRASVDSTNYITNHKNAIGYDGRKHYATLKPGKYRLETFIRMRDGKERMLQDTGMKYLAFRITDHTPTVGVNPAHPERGNPGYAEGILIHANDTTSWNTSEGCQVIYYKDYTEMIKMFGTPVLIKNQQGKIIGTDWDFSKSIGRKGYYYLISQ